MSLLMIAFLTAFTIDIVQSVDQTNYVSTFDPFSTKLDEIHTTRSYTSGGSNNGVYSTHTKYNQPTDVGGTGGTMNMDMEGTMDLNDMGDMDMGTTGGMDSMDMGTKDGMDYTSTEIDSNGNYTSFDINVIANGSSGYIIIEISAESMAALLDYLSSNNAASLSFIDSTFIDSLDLSAVGHVELRFCSTAFDSICRRNDGRKRLQVFDTTTIYTVKQYLAMHTGVSFDQISIRFRRYSCSDMKYETKTTDMESPHDYGTYTTPMEYGGGGDGGNGVETTAMGYNGGMMSTMDNNGNGGGNGWGMTTTGMDNSGSGGGNGLGMTPMPTMDNSGSGGGIQSTHSASYQQTTDMNFQSTPRRRLLTSGSDDSALLDKSNVLFNTTLGYNGTANVNKTAIIVDARGVNATALCNGGFLIDADNFPAVEYSDLYIRICTATFTTIQLSMCEYSNRLFVAGASDSDENTININNIVCNIYVEDKCETDDVPIDDDTIEARMFEIVEISDDGSAIGYTYGMDSGIACDLDSEFTNSPTGNPTTAYPTEPTTAVPTGSPNTAMPTVNPIPTIAMPTRNPSMSTGYPTVVTIGTHNSAVGIYSKFSFFIVLAIVGCNIF